MTNDEGGPLAHNNAHPGSTQDILHGGARRLSTRIIAGHAHAGQRVSWYEIAPGEQCSRHVHQGKTETWLVLVGVGLAQVGSNSIPVEAGDMIITRAGTPHGLVNTGSVPLRFVNIALEDGQGPLKTTELDGE